jgi:SAM-dependent methyltransferase
VKLRKSHRVYQRQGPLPYHTHPEFDSVFRCRTRPLPDVNTAIHNDDEMFLNAEKLHETRKTALWEYFAGGLQMLNLVRDVARKKCDSLMNIQSFLDFASGYGRFTRFLVKELPRERVWISDIYENAVKFQQQQFGVHGIVSVPDPDNYQCGRRFDFVFVASLFSHLPEAMFKKWLRKLYGLLAPEGVLVFSVHDQAVLPQGVAMPATGFFFLPLSESRSLDKNQYGSTWVTEDFVRNVIVESTGRAVYARGRRALWNFQDVYVVANGEQLSPSDYRMAWGSEGCIDQCAILPSSQLLLSGWAVDLSPGGAVAEVQLWIDGKMIARAEPNISRPDIALHFNNEALATSGWRFASSVPASIGTVVVNLVNNLGMENFLQFYKRGTSGFIVSDVTCPSPSVTQTAGKSLIFAPGNGFEGIQEAVNATMSRTADGLRIHALSEDPQIILPTLEGVMPGNKLAVHAQLVSPGPTEFQIFYGTSAVGGFDEAHSARKPIQKGDNDVVVEFTEPGFNGKIRLDPGMLPGDYILKLVEVRTTPTLSVP